MLESLEAQIKLNEEQIAEQADQLLQIKTTEPDAGIEEQLQSISNTLQIPISDAEILDGLASHVSQIDWQDFRVADINDLNEDTDCEVNYIGDSVSCIMNDLPGDNMQNYEEKEQDNAASKTPNAGRKKPESLFEMSIEERRLNQQAANEDAAFSEHTKKKDNKLKELAINIRMKEELIRTLVKNEQDAEKAVAEYEMRVVDLEREVQELKRNIFQKEQDIQSVTEEVAADMENKYHQQLGRMETLLVSMREKHSSMKQELKKQRAHEKSGLKRAKMLEQEVSEMRAAQHKIKRDNREYAKQYKQMKAEHARKVNVLRQKAARSAAQVKSVVRDNAKIKASLKKKTREMELLKKQQSSRRPSC